MDNLNERSRKFQFIHLEAYSLQANKQGGKNAKFNEETKARTVSEVLGEALRKEGFCNHVEEPTAPNVLYGDMANIEADCKHYHENHKNTDKNGKAKALRSDANVLLAGVISLEGIPENYEDWESYKKDAVKFLQEKYGENLAAVIEHTDEENPHLHFYILPKVGQKLDELHDGKKAVLELKSKEPKALKGKQNKAYIEAMKTFQDKFYDEVSRKYGLTKTGPARSRVSRKIYFEQKKAAEEYRKTLDLVEENKIFIDQEFEIAKKDFDKNLEKEKKDFDKNLEKERSLFEKEKRIIIKKTVQDSYSEAMQDFSDKNYINKMLFSMTFNKNKIKQQEKQIKHLIKEGKFHFERKLAYKEDNKKLIEYKEKYESLRKDFDVRVERKLDFKNKEILKINHDLKKIKLENEYLKEEISELKEKAKFAFEFLEKAKKYFGSKFESFKNDLFKKLKADVAEYKKPENQKLKF